MTFDVEAFFNNYNTSGVSDTAYTNKVYLGRETVPAGKTVSPTGVEYITKKSKTDKVLSVTEAKRRYLTDDKLRLSWAKTLQRNGINADPIQARAIWDLSVDGASDWYSTSNGQQKITPEQYVQWYASGKTGGKGAGNVPTRQIYAPTEDQIGADINDIALKSLGREITDADKQEQWYKDLLKGITKLYNKGTVTTVETVKNKKTGKVEKVVKQTPKFSKEQVSQKITSTLTSVDPESAARAENLAAIKWIFDKEGWNI